VGYAIAAIVGFVLGGIMFAVIVTRSQGIDIRSVGSGNPGFTNVYRAVSAKAGGLVLVGDIAKGAAAVAVGRAVLPAFVAGDPLMLGLVAGIAAILGHAFPVFFGCGGHRWRVHAVSHGDIRKPKEALIIEAMAREYCQCATKAIPDLQVVEGVGQYN